MDRRSIIEQHGFNVCPEIMKAQTWKAERCRPAGEHLRHRIGIAQTGEREALAWGRRAWKDQRITR